MFCFSHIDLRKNWKIHKPVFSANKVTKNIEKSLSFIPEILQNPEKNLIFGQKEENDHGKNNTG
jgi:hypothetical protein